MAIKLNLIKMNLSLLICVFVVVTSALTPDPYNTKLASRLTYLSSIAYESQQLIEKWACESCNKFPILNAKVVSNDSNSVYGYVAYDPDYQAIVIAFRGSVDTANWILNLKTVRTGYDLCSGCSVHIGFNQGFNSVKDQVQTQINHLLSLYRHNKFMITGHSLGGALAVMAAAHIQNVYRNVDQLYTMGQPRVGNDIFADFMTSFIPNTYRIVHNADQVPHVPQSILGFKHSGFQIWYEREMQFYTICPSESKGCSNQLNIFQLTQADHKMYLYLMLKVEDDYSLQSLSNFIRFHWVNLISRKKIFNLDIQTMREQDGQIKQWIENSGKAKAIHD